MKQIKLIHNTDSRIYLGTMREIINTINFGYKRVNKIIKKIPEKLYDNDDLKIAKETAENMSKKEKKEPLSKKRDDLKIKSNKTRKFRVFKRNLYTIIKDKEYKFIISESIPNGEYKGYLQEVNGELFFCFSNKELYKETPKQKEKALKSIIEAKKPFDIYLVLKNLNKFHNGVKALNRYWDENQIPVLKRTFIPYEIRELILEDFYYIYDNYKIDVYIEQKLND